ncbi:MAG: hypothetical protein KF802_02665 [Bdellovibrionaceae bacterium]|nr:hypothetical protein [Pseudobdellovibrionaceae bacterium]
MAKMRKVRDLIEKTILQTDIHWPIFFQLMEEIVGEISEEKKQGLKVSVLELKVIRLEEKLIQSETKSAGLETTLRGLGVVGIIKSRN